MFLVLSAPPSHIPLWRIIVKYAQPDAYLCLAMEGDADCGGLLAYNYFSGEHITGFEEGRPLFVRTPDSKFNLANFMRVNLFASLGVLKAGMDILLKDISNSTDSTRNELINFAVNASLDKIYFILVKTLNSAE